MPERIRMTKMRKGKTYNFKVADLEGYLTTGETPGGNLGEIFLSVSKQGSTISGLMNTIAILTSLLLQYGVSPAIMAQKFKDVSFEPRGKTNDDQIPEASSVVDYIFRRLELDYA